MPETGIRYDQHHRIIDGNGKILVTNPSDPATGGYVTENQLKEWISGDVPEEIESLGQRVSAAEGDIETLDGKVDAVEEDVDAIEDKVTAIESTDRDHKRRIADLEFDVMDLQSALDGISQVEFSRETKGGTFDVPTPSRGDLANGADVMKVNGKTVVWNQLFGAQFLTSSLSDSWSVAGDTLTISAHTLNTYDSTYRRTYGILSTGAKKGHVYMHIVSGQTFFEKVLFGTDSATLPIMDTEGVEKYTGGNATTIGISLMTASGADMSSSVTARISFVDLTTLFGVTETNQVTEAMKNWVRNYAEAHPQYDAGSLVDAVNVKVISRGKNWFDSVIDGFPNTNGSGINSANGTKTAFAKVDGKGGKFTVSCSRTCNRLMYGVSHSTSIVANNYTYVQTSDISGFNRALDVPSGWEYIFVYLGNDFSDSNFTVQFEIGEQPTSYVPPHSSHTLTIPSDWYTKASALGYDLGMEGAVIDMVNKVVTWNWGKYTFSGSEQWRGWSSVSYFAPSPTNIRVPISNGVASTIRVEDFETLSANSVNGETKCIGLSTGKALICSPANIPLLTGKTMLYELATPITKTFSELGFDPISYTISVWEGGHISVTSEGAQAEVEMKFMLNYSVDTRLTELETEVDVLNVEVGSLKEKNARQDAEIKTLQLMAEGTIGAMDTQSLDGYTVDVKARGVSGKVVGYGLLDEMEGRDVCWNQLSHTLTKTITISEARVNTWLNAYAFDTDNLKSSHKYFGMPCAVNGCVYQHPANGMRCSGIFEVLSAQESIPSVGIFATDLPVGTYTFEYALVDLTLMFPTDTPTRLSDPRIADLKSYLAEHPEYNAGTIVNNAVTEVRSEGANLFDGNCDHKYYRYLDGNMETSPRYLSFPNNYGKFRMKKGQTVTQSFKTIDGRPWLAFVIFDTDGSYKDATSKYGTEISYTATDDCDVSAQIYVSNNENNEYGSVSYDWMIEMNDVAHEYTPYRPPVILTLPSICTGLHGLPTARDKVEFKDRVYPNMVSVDLSTLNWSGSAETFWYSSGLPYGYKISKVYGFLGDVTDGNMSSMPYNTMANNADKSDGIKVKSATRPTGIIMYQSASGGTEYKAKVLESKVGSRNLVASQWIPYQRDGDPFFYTDIVISDAKTNGSILNASGATRLTQTSGMTRLFYPNYTDLSKVDLNGTLLYELAIPQTLDITDQVPQEQPLILVEDGGTLTFVNDNRVATPSTMTFPVQLGGNA